MSMKMTMTTPERSPRRLRVQLRLPSPGIRDCSVLPSGRPSPDSPRCGISRRYFYEPLHRHMTALCPTHDPRGPGGQVLACTDQPARVLCRPHPTPVRLSDGRMIHVKQCQIKQCQIEQCQIAGGMSPRGLQLS
jgi:hypothetical protein